MALQHLRSSTADKRPTPGSMSDGQLALNTNLASPGLFFKDSNGDLVKVGPVHVGTTAPNVSPAVGGQAGNSKGEQWLDTSSSRYVFKIWDGSAWRSETGEFVDAAGDVMTGALGIIAGTAAAPGLYISGDTNTGLFSLGADQLALSTGGTGRLFIDDGGRIMAGVSTALTNAYAIGTALTPAVQIQGNTANAAALSITRNTSAAANLLLQRGVTGTPVADTEAVGQISFNGFDGANYFNAALIRAVVDGTPGTGAMPGRLSFQTTPTGSTTPVERLRLDPAGQVLAASLGTAALPVWSFTGDPNTGIYSPGADQVAVATNGSGRLFVDSAGRVGAGVSSPGYPFDLVSQSGESIRIRGTSGTDVGKLLFTSNNAGADYGWLSSASSYLAFGTAASERMRLTSTGLGIGTSLPQELFNVSTTSVSDATLIRLDGGSGIRQRFFPSSGTGKFNWQIAAQSNVDNGFEITPSSTSGGSAFTTPAVVVKSNGNVGIGTPTPQGIFQIGTDFGGKRGGSSTDIVIADTTSGVTRFLEFQSASNATRSILFSDATTGNYGSIGYNHSDDALVFQTAANERARLDSSGRWLLGTSSARSNDLFATSQFQVEGTDAGTSSISITRNTATTGAGGIALCKSRSTSTGGVTVVQSGDVLGFIDFQGADGTDFARAATITAEVDGTPGNNDMPGRIVLATTADGAASPTERMRIGNDGQASLFASGNLSLVVSSAKAAGTTDYTIQARYGASANTGGTTSFQVYTNGNTQNTNNSYAGISDVKLKENIVSATSQWSDIKALQVRKYNFKEGQTHTQIGLIAQEVELVSPGLVSESPDRDAEGNDIGTVTKSVNYSVLYMKAVKALQEAMERIETLEAKVAALESA